MVVFISASESHNQANVRRSIAQSLEPLAEIAAIASGENIALCGAVATSFGCPFEGEVDPSQVLRVIERFVRQGIDRVSLGDTTGMATPPIIRRLCQSIAREFPQLQVALHFHNTRGLGLVNVVTGLELGITRFESSFGGLGGCPFAVGATGNVCTEDLVYLMDELGIASGIGLGGMIEIAQSIQTILGHDLPGQVMKAGPRLRTPRTIG
jgi:hydroxymethylglutaryl-CoA lyase